MYGRYGVMVVETLRKDLGMDGRIILKWILRNMMGNAWTGFIWLRTGTSGGLL
jgi:hypothetical protein